MNETRLISKQCIADALTMAEVVATVEHVYRAHGLGEVVMPPKVNLDLSASGEANWINAMPAYIPSLDAAGIKWAGGFANNPTQRGMEYLQGIIVLIDPQCGVPRAIMDGSLITSMRTGATAAVAAQMLASPAAGAATIFGAGTQGLAAARALLGFLPGVKRLYICDRNSEAAARFVARIGSEFDANVESLPPEEAVRRSEIVITLTTANAPLVQRDWLRPGCLALTMGSYQELDSELVLTCDRLIVDDLRQALHRGELAHLAAAGRLCAADIHAEMGMIAAGSAAGRTDPDQRIVTSLVGLGSLDIACAALVYEKVAQQEALPTFSFD